MLFSVHRSRRLFVVQTSHAYVALAIDIHDCVIMPLLFYYTSHRFSLCRAILLCKLDRGFMLKKYFYFALWVFMVSLDIFFTYAETSSVGAHMRNG